MLKNNFRVSIQTKSPLVTRDVDLLGKYTSLVDVGFTITTLDPEVSRLIEPGAPPPPERARALRLVSRAGIYTWVFIGPIIRGINDSRKNLEEIIGLAAETDSKVYYDYLHIKPGLRESMREIIDKNPKVFVMGAQWRSGVEGLLRDLCRKYIVDCKAAFPQEKQTSQYKITQYL